MSGLNEPDTALLELLTALRGTDYDFTAVTPLTHKRVLARPDRAEARDLRDIFGWSLPFREEVLPPPLLDILRRADAVAHKDGLLKSRYRVARLGDNLFLHSAYPTDSEDSVFFGPDTYRFADMVRAELPRIGPVRRLVDIGTGSGAGAIHAAAMLPDARLTLVDINPEALRLAAINAAFAGLTIEPVEGGIEEVAGTFDLAIANPPYIIDDAGRAYRDGGGMHGAELSLEWTLAAARRLAPGGHVLLYTGVAIVGGRDALREALEAALPPLGCSLRYREIDPDIFGEELEEPGYGQVERIAAIGAVISRD